MLHSGAGNTSSKIATDIISSHRLLDVIMVVVVVVVAIVVCLERVPRERVVSKHPPHVVQGVHPLGMHVAAGGPAFFCSGYATKKGGKRTSKTTNLKKTGGLVASVPRCCKPSVGGVQQLKKMSHICP